MADVITAGFPCQPFSVAGKRKAAADDRNMWPSTIKTISIVRPAFVLLENVPGLLSHEYAITIINDLIKIQYEVLPPIKVGADDIGANHRRKRIWIVGYTERQGLGKSYDHKELSSRIQQESGNGRDDSGKGSHVSDRDRPGQHPSQKTGIKARNDTRGSGSILADAEGRGKRTAEQSGQGNGFIKSGKVLADTEGITTGRLPVRARKKKPGLTINSQDVSNAKQSGLEKRQRQKDGYRTIWKEGQAPTESNWWSAEPDLGRLAYGIPNRVDRLRAIGNAQVPAVVKAVWELLLKV